MFKRYPEEIIDEIRAHNDIVDVVTDYVKLEKKGKDFFGLCPFHKEKTPSFSVAPLKQIFYCFGCGKGGNVIQFIMNAENLDYPDALKLLADRARITLPEGESEEEQEKARLKQDVIRINTEAARFYHSSLKSPQGVKAVQYLKSRGINENTTIRFGLGYSPENRDTLYRYFREKGFNEMLIIKSGLVIPDKNGGYHDRFRGRVIFPIFDVRGNVIAFGGRVIDSSMPKYVNSPETPVYSKGKHLYALNFAKGSSEGRILVVEGYMDVISLHQSGISNTVAPLGTALTESQGRILRKYAEEIIISFDADSAGQAAAMRGLDLLDDIGCNVKVLVIPDGKDPDEYIKRKGAAEFKKLIDNSITFVEYKIRNLKKQINTDTVDGKISFLNKMASILAKVNNRVEKEIYIRKLADEYAVSEDAIKSELEKRSLSKSNNKPAAIRMKSNDTRRSGTSSDSEIDNKLIHSEKILIGLLCLDNKAYGNISGRIGTDDFSDSGNRLIAGFVLDRLRQGRGVTVTEAFDILEKQAADSFAKIINEECNCEDINKAVLDILKRIEKMRLEKRRKEIYGLIKSIEKHEAEGDVETLKIELNTVLVKEKSL